jgi:hypothetical protein
MPINSSQGRFDTPNASRYLQQLCKHFAHKTEVDYDETRGTAKLPGGPATLSVTDEALIVTLESPDPEALKKAKHIIDSHLERFAFREDFKGMAWSPLND